MAKRRTKKERLRAKTNRDSAPKRKVQAEIEVKPTQKKDSPKLSLPVGFFSQDPRLIKTDLKKTLLVTLFVLLVLFTIALLYT